MTQKCLLSIYNWPFPLSLYCQLPYVLHIGRETPSAPPAYPTLPPFHIPTSSPLITQIRHHKASLYFTVNFIDYKICEVIYQNVEHRCAHKSHFHLKFICSNFFYSTRHLDNSCGHMKALLHA